LDNKEISELKFSYVNNDKDKALCFYQNFDIISKEMIEILKQIDINIEKKIIRVFCIYDRYKIIMLLKPDLLNIYYYFNTEETIIQYIILSKEAISLFNSLIIKGFNFIEQYLPYNKANIEINYNKYEYEIIHIIIYKLFHNNKVEFRMSDKLKALILLAYFQNKLYDNNLHEVYLINHQWLKQYNYNCIKSSVDKNYKEMQKLSIDYYNLNSVFDITKYLNQKYLMNFDNELVFFIPNPTTLFDSPTKKFEISNKSLILFKKFILCDKKIINQLQQNFGITLNNYNISYLHKKEEGDFIIIKKYPLTIENMNKDENLIIFGNYDNFKCKLNIKYIFEYENTNILEQELSYIINNTINYYLNERTNFNKNNKYNSIFSIIENNQIIGNLYLYKKIINYGKTNNNNNNINNNYNSNMLQKLEIKKNIKDYMITTKGEKIFSVNFLSMCSDDVVNFSLACKNTDLFSTLEDKFYNNYPNLRNKICFFCHTNQIDRNKTLDENQIKSNDNIAVVIIEK